MPLPFTDATPDPQPTYEALQFDGSEEHATGLIPVINAALAAGLLSYGHAEGKLRDGGAWWQIRLKRPIDIDETIVVAGMWVTVSSTGAVRGLTDAEYQAGVR
jgi:hypothetical protein